MHRTVNLVSSKYDVIIFDFRGHGDSKGKFSWSAKEHLDVAAILDYVKSQNYKGLGILAFSLGAAAAVNAVSTRKDVNTMVLVSCPSDFWKIDYHFWEPEMLSDLKDNIECDWGGKGSRVTNIFLKKQKPIETITRIKNTAISFIHGDKDWIIKDYHSKVLYDAALTYKEMKIIKGGLHAERLIQQFPDKMRDLILDWFQKTIKGGGAD